MKVILTKDGLKYHTKLICRNDDKQRLKPPPRIQILRLEAPREETSYIQPICVKTPKIKLSPYIKERYMKYCSTGTAKDAALSEFREGVDDSMIIADQFNEDYIADLSRKRRNTSGSYQPPQVANKIIMMKYRKLLERYNYRQRQQSLIAEGVKAKRERLAKERSTKVDKLRFSIPDQSQAFLDRLRSTNSWQRRKERISAIHEKNYFSYWRLSKISNLALPKRRTSKYMGLHEPQSKRSRSIC